MLWAFLALKMDLEMVFVVKVMAKKMRDKLQSQPCRKTVIIKLYMIDSSSNFADK